LTALLIVAIVGFAVGTIPALTGRDPKSFPILPILCGLGLSMLSFPVAGIVIKRRTLSRVPPPVQFRRYVQKQHVSFRFRRPEYAADFVSYLEAAARSAEH
jgi:hypothetical protein